MIHEDHLGAKSNITRTESIICGGIAGLVSRFVISPLDVVKIRLQLQVGNTESVPGATVWKTVKNTYQNEGIRVFWKGNVPAEIMYVMYGAIQFTTYRSVSRFLAKNAAWMPDNTNLFVSGALAGVTATTVSYPLDLLRTRFAADLSRQASSIIPSIKAIAHHDGPRGFFRGLTPTLASLIPNMGLFFVVYAETRKVMKATSIDALLPAPEASAGFIAGVVSKGIVFPLDVIRKRLQVQGPSYSQRRDIPVYSTNIYKCARQILANEGIRGLYKGYFVSLMKSGPSSAVTIWTFERSLTALRRIKGTLDP